MEPDQALQTIAEVAIALAGFASLVAVIRQRGSVGWSPRALAGFRFMVELSLSAVVFSIVPFWLSSLALTEPLVWAWSSAGLAAVYIVLLSLNFRRSTRLSTSGVPHPQPVQATLGLALGGCLTVALVLSALDLGLSRGPSTYLLALIALLIGVANQFLNFVAGAQPPAEGPD